MERIAVRILAPRSLRDAFEALVRSWEGFEVGDDSSAVTLVAGPTWREHVARLGEDAAVAVLASPGDCREALRRNVLVIVANEEPADLIHHGLRSAARGEPYWSPRVVR